MDDVLEKLKKAGYGEKLRRDEARARYEEIGKKGGQPPSGGLEGLVERKIRQAVEEGALDNLPGKGQPLPENNYMETPEHLRVAYHMLSSAGFLPEEVRLKREMGLVLEELGQSEDERVREVLRRKLCDISARFNMCMEYNRQFKKRAY